MKEKSVVFPAPFGPTRPMRSWRFTCSDTSANNVRPPNALLNPQIVSIRSAGCCAGAREAASSIPMEVFLRAHLESTTKLRRKRAPVAELESSANPQPGKAALRSARFPACGFGRLASRQLVVLSRCAREDADNLRNPSSQRLVRRILLDSDRFQFYQQSATAMKR